MSPQIRRILPQDNESVAALIRTVMPEFGAGGAGFAIHDSEVNNMFSAYSQSRCAYFVCEEQGTIIGGGGVAPLQGSADNICELKKMYFLPEGRGRGLGQKLLNECLRAAVDFKFHQCYIETFNTMHSAMKLYERNGFQRIAGPLGNTGHFSCDIFYSMDLTKLDGYGANRS